MITGVVVATLDATLALLVCDSTGQPHQSDMIVDTGFNGELTLPGAQVAFLGLTWISRNLGRLADGSILSLDTYAATVIWDGQRRDVVVEAIDGQPLVGMKMLQGQVLRIEVTVGGSVTIEPLP